MITMPDYSSIMNWAIGIMVNSELPWFLRKSSKYIGRLTANLLFAIYFILIVWLYDAWLIPGINLVGSIVCVWRMAVKAVILLYKRQFTLKRWYFESLSKAHTTPYGKLGIKL